jgi:hypothetical protein
MQSCPVGSIGEFSSAVILAIGFVRCVSTTITIVMGWFGASSAIVILAIGFVRHGSPCHSSLVVSDARQRLPTTVSSGFPDQYRASKSFITLLDVWFWRKIGFVSQKSGSTAVRWVGDRVSDCRLPPAHWLRLVDFRSCLTAPMSRGEIVGGFVWLILDHTTWLFSSVQDLAWLRTENTPPSCIMGHDCQFVASSPVIPEAAIGTIAQIGRST